MRIHIVQKGDTLDKIAQKYNVPVMELRKANPGFSTSDVIERGEKIKIPIKMPSVKKEAPIKKEQPVAPIQEKPVAPIQENHQQHLFKKNLSRHQ
ncbi:LysM domain-containing protein [Bacillus sp. NEB1478]|uniref:LysM peptidoglycan-binding domain-containing protein n=1 Tax=Bacillus sp. NEB1478 TaxID=3073816 RepID=UPI002873667E|nr:LysM domain-containing protein [Bacillus sp. NEB1478]WNB93283.1 LysM domain-containing protein [Bacillus sp. NEB1478]